jgi:hypothetical protein
MDLRAGIALRWDCRWAGGVCCWWIACGAGWVELPDEAARVAWRLGLRQAGCVVLQRMPGCGPWRDSCWLVLGLSGAVHLWLVTLKRGECWRRSECSAPLHCLERCFMRALRGVWRRVEACVLYGRRFWAALR